MKKTLINRYNKYKEVIKSNDDFIITFSEIFDDSMFIIFAYNKKTGEIKVQALSLNIRLNKKRYKDVWRWFYEN